MIFDGFDEPAARVTACLDGLLAILDGPEKVTDGGGDEVLTKTGEKVERILGRFIARLEDFACAPAGTGLPVPRTGGSPPPVPSVVPTALANHRPQPAR
ncbi:hypothetical protein [Frankia tisae]|uniref:hypothetical protein n=1 Tax=Frankia tisae TaxID=2950104 RepID=UPI0021BFA830|nr:hypothetical protein [Frankia tisae]